MHRTYLLLFNNDTVSREVSTSTAHRCIANGVLSKLIKFHRIGAVPHAIVVKEQFLMKSLDNENVAL